MIESKELLEKIDKVFHSPKRLAIMTVLCGCEEGIAFKDLKKECRLTDGNLNSHLKALKKEEMVRIEKTFIGEKPRTTIFISEKGYDSFYQYLENLTSILVNVKQKMKE